MSDREIVNTSELRLIASDIRDRKNIIIDIYESNIKSLLLESEKRIIESGEDYEECLKTYESLFSDLDNNIDELVTTLVDKIIPVYEDLSSNIKELFNNQFAKELESILDINTN